MSVPQVLYRVLSFTLRDQILWKCERLQNRVDSEARPRSSEKQTYKRPSTFWKQKFKQEDKLIRVKRIEATGLATYNMNILFQVICIRL